jgi:hypothetical protein
MVAEIRYRCSVIQAQVRKNQLARARKKLEVAQRTISEATDSMCKTNRNVNPSTIARRQRQAHSKFNSLTLDSAHGSRTTESQQGFDDDDDFWE